MSNQSCRRNGKVNEEEKIGQNSPKNFPESMKDISLSFRTSKESNSRIKKVHTQTHHSETPKNREERTGHVAYKETTTRQTS